MADFIIASDVKYARQSRGRFAAHLDEAAMQTMIDLINKGVDAARNAAPDGPDRDDYGRRPKLRTNIQIGFIQSHAAMFYIDAVNALSQETGAVPHGIDARNVKNLRFFWEREGVNFVGPHVNHPGNEAQPFMEIGFEAMDAAAESVIVENY